MVGIVVVSHSQKLAEGAVELAKLMAGDANIAAAGGDEHPTEERRAGYYCSAKICHNNACAGIAGHQ